MVIAHHERMLLQNHKKQAKKNSHPCEPVPMYRPDDKYYTYNNPDNKFLIFDAAHINYKNFRT